MFPKACLDIFRIDAHRQFWFPEGVRLMKHVGMVQSLGCLLKFHFGLERFLWLPAHVK